jgi:sugar diacid utilization regulator
MLSADRDCVQRDLLEDLFTAQPPSTAARLAAARAAGLENGTRCLVVAALPTEPPEDESVLRLAAGTLANAIRSRAPPLVVTRHGEVIIVRAVAQGERPALANALQSACEKSAHQGLVLAVGVSTIHDGLSGLDGAYREASLALGRIPKTGGVISLTEMSAFDYLTLREDPVARRVLSPEIAGFVAEDRAHGGQLIRTVEAYAAADLNFKAAAEQLLIHVNTAHHRLARVAERTGCDLRHLTDIVDLLIAIKLFEQPHLTAA